MVENLDIEFIIPCFAGTESLHHVIEKEWEICQADAIITCLTVLFQINHKYFFILISKAETWYTKCGVCLLVGELSFLN